jgi:hypothetical protein
MEAIVNGSGYPFTDLLMKIKLFLKITRLIVDNAKQQISKAVDKEKEFFTM